MHMRYDSFISYNSEDVGDVRIIVEYLRNAHFRVYFDRTDLLAGQDIERELDDALSASDTVIVVVGANGISTWQRLEYLYANRISVKTCDKPIIPLVLPGGSLDHQSVPGFLRVRSAVTFLNNVEEEENLQRLQSGILQYRLTGYSDKEFEKPVTQHEFDQLLLSTVNGYNEKAEQFHEVWKDDLPHDKFSLLEKHLKPKSCLLDAGCGPGHHSAYFHSRGFAVTGIDLASEPIRIAKDHYSGVTFIKDDMRETRFNRSTFDAVWSCASCVHTPDSFLDRQLREFIRILKPGGLLGITIAVERLPAVERDGRFFEGYRDQQQILKYLELSDFEILETSTSVTKKMTDDERRVARWVAFVGRVTSKAHAAIPCKA